MWASRTSMKRASLHVHAIFSPQDRIQNATLFHHQSHVSPKAGYEHVRVESKTFVVQHGASKGHGRRILLVASVGKTGEDTHHHIEPSKIGEQGRSAHARACRAREYHGLRASHGPLAVQHVPCTGGIKVLRHEIPSRASLKVTGWYRISSVLVLSVVAQLEGWNGAPSERSRISQRRRIRAHREHRRIVDGHGDFTSVISAGDRDATHPPAVSSRANLIDGGGSVAQRSAAADEAWVIAQVLHGKRPIVLDVQHAIAGGHECPFFGDSQVRHERTRTCAVLVFTQVEVHPAYVPCRRKEGVEGRVVVADGSSCRTSRFLQISFFSFCGSGLFQREDLHDVERASVLGQHRAVEPCGFEGIFRFFQLHLERFGMLLVPSDIHAGLERQLGSVLFPHHTFGRVVSLHAKRMDCVSAGRAFRHQTTPCDGHRPSAARAPSHLRDFETRKTRLAMASTDLSTGMDVGQGKQSGGRADGVERSRIEERCMERPGTQTKRRRSVAR
eukprot:scaffold2848_cov352-Pavlova_lutheri.AAC.20